MRNKPISTRRDHYKTKLYNNAQNLQNLSSAGNPDSIYNDSGLPWNIGIGRQALKLSIVMLCYFYSVDDDKISIFEKLSFKKQVGSIKQFTKEDKKELSNIINMLPDENFVLGYINRNNLTKDIVTSSFKYLKEEIGLNKEDTKTIDQFIKKYKKIQETE